MIRKPPWEATASARRMAGKTRAARRQRSAWTARSVDVHRMRGGMRRPGAVWHLGAPTGRRLTTSTGPTPASSARGKQGELVGVTRHILIGR